MENSLKSLYWSILDSIKDDLESNGGYSSDGAEIAATRITKKIVSLIKENLEEAIKEYFNK